MRYSQDGYDETGAGVWNQSVGSGSSTYSAATVGLGLEKRMKKEEIEVHLGYKRVLSGSDPTYPVHWLDGGDEHIARGSGLDKNLLVLGARRAEAGGQLEPFGRYRARSGEFPAKYPGLGNAQEELVI